MAEASTAKPSAIKRFGDWIKDKVSSEPEKPKEAKVNIYNIAGQLVEQDYRVRIKVPGNYIRESTAGNPGINELADGIIFPYTPQISYDLKADYQTQNVVHSNYTQYFYNYSAAGQISIQGKFTVQNDRDARVYLATKHLLSALTKMPYGDDPAAGSPPPVCRLYAYGDYMFKDIPIVIANFRLELPNDVDYYNYGKAPPKEPAADDLQEIQVTLRRSTNPPTGLEEVTVSASKRSGPVVGENYVPVSSTFNITCYPIYSRREMLQFRVKDFLESYNTNTKYL